MYQIYHKKRKIYTNKFIYAGKFRSINILNREIIYPTNFKSNFLSGLSTNDNILSYSAFKQMNGSKKYNAV